MSEKVIYFYRPADPYGEWSNFARIQVVYRGLVWPTSEALFQACKFPHNPEYREQIRLAPNPARAAELGRSRTVRIRDDWNDVRDGAMLWVQKLKHQQHPDLQEMLLDSGAATLVENSPKDWYWGIGRDGAGKNKLGLTLMHLRTLLREKGPAVLVAVGT